MTGPQEAGSDPQIDLDPSGATDTPEQGIDDPSTDLTPLRHVVRHKDGGTVVIGNYYRARAIRAHCTECLGWETNPRDCTSPLCALYPFRGKLRAAMTPRLTAEEST